MDQESVLYAGTVMFNITIGITREGCKMSEEGWWERVQEACRQSNLLEDVNQWPDKLDTVIGETQGAHLLSGGQVCIKALDH
eukprot:7368141-Pyramimonas_sp.AAC.1